MTEELIDIDEVAGLWGIGIRRLKKHRPRISVFDNPAGIKWKKPLYEKQKIIQFAIDNDIKTICCKLEQIEWAKRIGRDRPVKSEICLNAARAW
jgi:hypothetical protein